MVEYDEAKADELKAEDSPEYRMESPANSGRSWRITAGRSASVPHLCISQLRTRSFAGPPRNRLCNQQRN